jgi:site-specific DNA-methyltransferase (adenine-specific)
MREDGSVIELHLGDCLEIMGGIADASIDLILCDLPYGVTALRWDQVIPFEPLWDHYKRLLKPRGAVVLTASQPFTSMLVMSNPKWFRYEWIWEKQKPTGFLDARRKPLNSHESVLIFGSGPLHYSPQGLIPCLVKNGRRNKAANGVYRHVAASEYVQEQGNFPRSVIRFPTDTSNPHPTAKPVALMEYLIRTYSDEGDTVLDNAMGSGTTLEACLNTNRHGIGIEKHEPYFRVAQQRLAPFHLIA